MEPLKQKISDPNYANSACSGLDQFFCQSSADTAVQGNQQPSSINNNRQVSTSEVLEAADLLEFWCNNQESSATTADASILETSAVPSYPVAESAPAAAPPDNPLPDLSIADAADLLELDRPSILELITSGRLNATKDAQGRRVISRASILEWLRSQSAAESRSPNPAPPEVKAAENISVSTPPMETVAFIAKLQEAQGQLQAATYRIGYLEQEIEACRQQLKLLPDMQAQADRLAQVEKENEELRRSWPKLQAKIGRLKELEIENSELRQLLEEQSASSGGLWSSLKSMFFGGSKSRRLKERAGRTYAETYETSANNRFR